MNRCVSLTKRSWIRSVALLCVAVLSQWTQATFAQIPAIPKFAIQYWDVPGRIGAITVLDMNDLGQITGVYKDADEEDRPFLYSPLVSRTAAYDLEDLFGTAGIPEGWKFKTAYQISNNGLILGALTTIDPDIIHPVTGKRPEQGFVIDTLAPSPSVTLLPKLDGIAQYRPTNINNAADMVGLYWAEDGTSGKFFFNPDEYDNLTLLDPQVYMVLLGERINGVATVGGQYGPQGRNVFRWNPQSGTMTVVPNISTVWGLSGMNDFGNFSGTQTGTIFGMRIIGNTMQSMWPYTQFANAINNANDVLLSGGYLYRDDRGTIFLRSYLSGSRADLAMWDSATLIWTSKLNDRDTVTKYGQMAGHLNVTVNGVSGQQPFLLTPIAKKR